LLSKTLSKVLDIIAISMFRAKTCVKNVARPKKTQTNSVFFPSKTLSKVLDIIAISMFRAKTCVKNVARPKKTQTNSVFFPSKTY